MVSGFRRVGRSASLDAVAVVDAGPRDVPNGSDGFVVHKGGFAAGKTVVYLILNGCGKGEKLDLYSTL